jgi:hypothetical protein
MLAVKKDQTTFIQKVLLFLFSLVLLFAILETGLRLGGYFFFLKQGVYNKTSPGEYRILCIGESTTALGGKDSYPYQLEEILNQKYPAKKFNVINKGRPANLTGDLLFYMKENLDRYRPDMVVFLMGINDVRLYKNMPQKWWQKLKDNTVGKTRVYRLLNLLRLHLINKMQEIKAQQTTAGMSPATAVFIPEEIVIKKASIDMKDEMDDPNALHWYPEKTARHYNAMVKMALDRNIRVICLQYPLRPIDALKNMVQSREQVTFVENVDNFADALEANRAKEFFADSFAVYFGHCTRKGNRLIAERLADHIISLIGLEK